MLSPTPMFKKMYDEVYDCMVDYGLARCFDQPSSLNLPHLKTKYHLTHSEMCLVVQEVGRNISQKGDSHIGGQKYVCQIETVPENKISHNDCHFIALEFTAFGGSPVLCVIIIAGMKQTYEVETGLDMNTKIVVDPTDSDSHYSMILQNQLESLGGPKQNSDNGQNRT